MILSFFDDEQIGGLFPLTLTRPAADLRIGILTIAEKWKKYLHAAGFGYETRDYLSTKFAPVANPQWRINGRLVPTPDMIHSIAHLLPGQRLVMDGLLLAERTGGDAADVPVSHAANLISRPYHLFLKTGVEVDRDFAIVVPHRQPLPENAGITWFGAHPVYIEKGAKVKACILNTENGPIYVGKNAEIMEGSIVRGPFAMGEGAVLKLGTKVYGPTALGPYCVAGGELNNVQMQGYSNKGHDGFLGNAVLGEWCNIGADSNCSNLKNNYEEVKVWNYETGRFEKSGQQFCGLIMGDHSKCGINTMFNTGTVVGVSANIFGAGFPRQFVPDFAWGGASGFVTYKPEAAAKTASLVMPRRKKVFDDTEKGIMEKVFEMTAGWRNWDAPGN